MQGKLKFEKGETSNGVKYWSNYILNSRKDHVENPRKGGRLAFYSVLVHSQYLRFACRELAQRVIDILLK